MTTLINSGCRIKVSSVLNRETTLYGKQFLTDDSEETCWNSEAGTPQFIIIDFARKVNIDTFQLMFQGGFVGKICQVLHWTDSLDFPVAESERLTTSRVKIVFETSSDFFGRITIYKLDILGQDA
ncbi:Nuclear receptor 2C2-associated protein [Linnemannia gamsii]|uniref:Nuclear receptor 2C2-associated protein n=1 Tax=Linnemannia gamsii TaxID=64522 RepID=A0ABQ7JYE6_9FUNG|nr:Nuclear receptor 2C2-associated protein [Linnemannia gamsii]